MTNDYPRNTTAGSSRNTRCTLIKLDARTMMSTATPVPTRMCQDM